MQSLDSLDDFLDFPADVGAEEDKDLDFKPSISPSGVLASDDPSRPLPETEECAEEELEWLSNKDAFPAVETFVNINLLTRQAASIGIAEHQSPVSVLDNSTTTVGATTTTTTTLMNSCGTLKLPHRARSKGRRRRCSSSFPGIPGKEVFWNQANKDNKDDRTEEETTPTTLTTIGRKCQHCGAESTPQWRAGPLGPKTLCNACGVRYKSGRLVSEYRPASSPTFSSKLHSNSHRKIIEMRKQKHGMGMVVKPVDKGFPGIPGQQLSCNQANEHNNGDRTKVETTNMTTTRKCQHCGAEKTPLWRVRPLGMKTLCNACWVRYKNRTAGRKCQHCGVEETPQWRAGPLGRATLCNSCGVRYNSGRLVTEYRPASSPNFSSELHSSFHRKIMEIRSQKHETGVVMKAEACG